MAFDNLSIIHLISDIDTVNTDNLLDRPVICSYTIDLAEENWDHTFQKLFSTQHPYFSLTIMVRDKVEFTDNWFNKLTLVLCHQCYFKNNNKLLIGIRYQGDNKKDIEKFSSELQLRLYSQGITNLQFIRVSPAELMNDTCFVFYNENTEDVDFESWYAHCLSQSHSRLNIYMLHEDITKTDRMIRQRHQAEKNLEAQQPLFYRHLKLAQAKAGDLSKYEMMIAELTEDIASKTAYLDFLLGKFKDGESIDVNAVMQIKRFYYHEYEILPLWYKRFGHIIKVITGKRTFRSLFDDKVKKYRD